MDLYHKIFIIIKIIKWKYIFFTQYYVTICLLSAWEIVCHFSVSMLRRRPRN